MRSILTAAKFLTPFPWIRSFSATPERSDNPATFLPVAGFCLGLILALLNWLSEPYLESEILGVVLSTILILMTRGQFLDGLRKTFGHLDSKGSEQGIMNATGDSRAEVFGFLAVMVIVLLKSRAIEVMGEARSQGLLLAPLFARWAMVVLAYSSKSGGTDRITRTNVRGAALLLSTIFTLTLVVLFAGRLGLWIALWVSLFALAGRLYLHRRFGGVGEDGFGAVAEISETFALLLFTSFF
jgi:adenosylcobinamide-GDP ribazoletransferase